MTLLSYNLICRTRVRQYHLDRQMLPCIGQRYTSGRTAAVVPDELPIQSHADMTFDIVDVEPYA